MDYKEVSGPIVYGYLFGKFFSSIDNLHIPSFTLQGQIDTLPLPFFPFSGRWNRPSSAPWQICICSVTRCDCRLTEKEGYMRYSCHATLKMSDKAKERRRTIKITSTDTEKQEVQF